MPDYASLEEVYGTPFGKRAPVTQSAENAVRPAVIRKPEEAVRRHEGLLDSLARSLPINTEQANYRVDLPQLRAPTVPVKTVEAFSDFSYAPPDYDLRRQIDRILKMVEQNKTGYEAAGSQDMLLYIFTGVFFLFTLDQFVLLGRHMR